MASAEEHQVAAALQILDLAASPDLWQTTRETIKDRNAYMFNNPLLSDITLLADDGEGREVEIPAHKYVLAIGSPVFFAMLYGELAEKECKIRIEDCISDSLLEFLRYIYTDKANLTGECVMGTLYLAKKYMVPFLEMRCLEFVGEYLNAENAFGLLIQGRAIAEERIEDICWSCIDFHTNDALKSDTFLDLDKNILMEFLKRDTTCSREINMFKAVQRWIEQSCYLEDLPEEERKKTIVDVTDLIRYPLMTQKEFAEKVAKTELLDKGDVIDIFLNFSDSLDNKERFKFSDKPRRGFYTCPLFESSSNRRSHNDSHKARVLSFKVDNPVTVCGIGLFGSGSREEEIFRINAEIVSPDGRIIGTFEDVIESYAGITTYDVVFNKFYKLSKNLWYSIRVYISGPPSVTGQNASNEIIGSSGNVKFCFNDLWFGGFGGSNGVNNCFARILYYNTL